VTQLREFLRASDENSNWDEVWSIGVAQNVDQHHMIWLLEFCDTACRGIVMARGRDEKMHPESLRRKF
jgi:hypothetical protein